MLWFKGPYPPLMAKKLTIMRKCGNALKMTFSLNISQVSIVLQSFIYPAGKLQFNITKSCWYLWVYGYLKGRRWMLLITFCRDLNIFGGTGIYGYSYRAVMLPNVTEYKLSYCDSIVNILESSLFI